MTSEKTYQLYSDSQYYKIIHSIWYGAFQHTTQTSRLGEIAQYIKIHTEEHTYELILNYPNKILNELSDLAVE